MTSHQRIPCSRGSLSYPHGSSVRAASLVLVALGMSSGNALAQDGAGGLGPAPEPDSTSELGSSEIGFSIMDRFTSRSFVELSLATTSFEGDDPDLNLRGELHAQFVGETGVGGYIAMPYAYLADGGESASGLSNIELGPIYHVGSPDDVSWILHAGLLLNQVDDGDTFVSNIATIFSRFNDLASIYPETDLLRLGASPTRRMGKLVVRADLGLDIPVNEPDGFDPNTLARFNVGAAYVSGGSALSLELVTVGNLEEGDISPDDRFIHQMAISYRGGLESGYDTFITLSRPLDENIEVNASIMAGMRFPLGN